MKRIGFLILLLFVFLVSSKAQETVELTFTASTQDGVYCPFDAIVVNNVTRGWTETLAYPDTVLSMNHTLSLNEYYSSSFHLGKAYPNPFTNKTNVMLDMLVSDNVSIQLFRVDGKSVIKAQNYLEIGLYRLEISLSSSDIAFMVVTSSVGRQIVRLVCNGNGGEDSILVMPFLGDYESNMQTIRGDAIGEFSPGDMMRYTAALFDGVNTVYSNTINQQQYESQVLTLHFDLALPVVITNQVFDINQTSATGGGNVIVTGSTSVTDRGICWSTSHNPTTVCSHSSSGTGGGEFFVDMTDLTANTTYYVRAYATNSAGTNYGNEVSFTTSQMPSYTISISCDPNIGGSVTGGGSYQQGQSCTVSVTPNTGYFFVNWTENGTQVSTDIDYTFIVSDNRTLVAQLHNQNQDSYPYQGDIIDLNKGMYNAKEYMSIIYQGSGACQGSAVFDDYLLVGRIGGTVILFDLVTKTALGAVVLESASTYNHVNNLSFGVEGDENNTVFPKYLYVSECDDTNNKNRCFVENITLSSSTLVQTINYNGTAYLGNYQYTIDTDNNYLYLSGNTKTAYNVSGNKIKILRFDLPLISEGDDITLSDEDIIDSWEYDADINNMYIFQGMSYYRNRLYMCIGGFDNGTGYMPHKIFVISPFTGDVVSVVDTSLFLREELESIGFYNCKIMACYAGKVYELNF